MGHTRYYIQLSYIHLYIIFASHVQRISHQMYKMELMKYVKLFILKT